MHVGVHAMEDCTSMMDILNKEHAPLGFADHMGALNGPLCYQITQYVYSGRVHISLLLLLLLLFPLVKK